MKSIPNRMDEGHTKQQGLTLGEEHGEHVQLQARTTLHGRLAAAIRPHGSPFRKGRSQDLARNVTRIRLEAATDADPRGDHEMATLHGRRRFARLESRRSTRLVGRGRANLSFVSISTRMNLYDNTQNNGPANSEELAISSGSPSQTENGRAVLHSDSESFHRQCGGQGC